ncbi:MAG: VOC family protein [Chitinophagales bacterium]
MEAKNPVIWFEIYVDNTKRAQKFYETILNIQLNELPMPEINQSMEMLFFPSNMEQHGASGALVKMDGFKAGSNSTVIYFHSDDCTTEQNRVEMAGGKVVQPKMSIGEYGFISLCIDTEGNMFGLHSLK